MSKPQVKIIIAEAEEWCEQHNIKREELLKKQYAEAQKTVKEIMPDV